MYSKSIVRCLFTISRSDILIGIMFALLSILKILMFKSLRSSTLPTSLIFSGNWIPVVTISFSCCLYAFTFDVRLFCSPAAFVRLLWYFGNKCAMIYHNAHLSSPVLWMLRMYFEFVNFSGNLRYDDARVGSYAVIYNRK